MVTKVATTEVKPPRKKPRGLRVKYSKEIAEKLLKEMEKGRTLSEICKNDKGMPTYASVQYWIRKGTHGFDKEYKKSREIQIQLWIDQMVDLAEEPPPTAPDTIEDRNERKLWVNAENQRRRLKIDTLKFIAAKLAPNLGYGEHHGLNVQGETVNIINYAVPKGEEIPPIDTIYLKNDESI